MGRERQLDRRVEIPHAAHDRAAATAFLEMVAGLQAMSTNFDRLVFNFGAAAATIAGDQDARSRIRGMMEFARAYHQFGAEVATEAIRENAGVPVDVVYGMDGRPANVTPGILVGLAGAEWHGRRKVFEGVAVIGDSRGRERFVVVYVEPNGHTQLHTRQYDYSQPDMISRRPLEDILPPRRT